MDVATRVNKSSQALHGGPSMTAICFYGGEGVGSPEMKGICQMIKLGIALRRGDRGLR